MSRNKCCVPGCHVTKDDGIPLHRFPDPQINTERYMTWTSSIGGLNKQDNKYVYNNLRVCRKHFKPDYLYPNHHLCKLAIPELQLPDKVKQNSDEDDNIIIEDQYPEEVTEEQLALKNKNNSEGHIKSILEKSVENLQRKEKQSVKNLADRFVLNKFDAKNVSVYQWIKVFEKECTRFDIVEDEKKIQIFRLFLEKSCTDWHDSVMSKLSLQSKWSEWKTNFVETYANKGWASSKYAIAFKYQSGSLLDYSIKKEKLLLEVRKTIDQGTLIDLIAAGLPDFITDRINKEDILETKYLFNEVGKLEYLVT